MNAGTRFTFRDIVWNYPETLLRLIDITRPLSLILLYVLFAGFAAYILMSSDILAEMAVKNTDCLVEGSIGHVDNLNPIFLTQNPIDQDIHALLFEKFIELDQAGNPVPAIAKSWQVSDDFMKYTFRLDTDIRFHDGEPLTVYDVKYTLDTAIYLAKQKNQDTVGRAMENISLKVIDKNTLQIKLSEPNATIFEALSIYIIPEHYYGQVKPEKLMFTRLNEAPLGSGAYTVVNIKEASILLKASEYYHPHAQIEYIEYRFYSTFTALQTAYHNGLLNNVSNLANYEEEFRKIQKGMDEQSVVLFNHQKLVYFNLRKEQLQSVSLRQGISYLIDKDKLLESSGYNGVVSNGPIHRNSWAYNEDAGYYQYKPEEAGKNLLDAGYTKNVTSGYYQTSDGKILSFTLTFLENEQNTALAEALRDSLGGEGVVIQLNPKTFDQISREIIATRDFELLLFEVETTTDPDQYNLWHKLKVDYPLLNLSGYNFLRVNKLLEDGRITNDRKERKEKYDDFQRYLIADAPVIFLAHPRYTYFTSSRLKGVNINNIRYSWNRFHNVAEWHWE